MRPAAGVPAILAGGLLVLWELGGSLLGWGEEGGLLPSAVAAAAVTHREPLVGAVAVTFCEAVLGFLLGIGVALPLAVAITHWRLLRTLLYPSVVSLKAVPMVLVAPLFWGEGMASKVIVAALIAVFPVLVNGVQGLDAIEPGVIDLARCVNASRRAVLWHLRLPAALPYLFPALRTAATLAMVGVVGSELVSLSRGAGGLIVAARRDGDVPLAVAVLACTVLCNLGLFAALAVVERAVVFWRRPTI